VKQHIFMNRVDWKGSILKRVIRHPGVYRVSKLVLGVNEVMAKVKPAKKCKGKHFFDGTMQACMRDKLIPALEAAGFPRKK